MLCVQVKLLYNFIHDENEEDLIFIRMLLARRPWEASSNQVTNTWQAFTDAIRMQQDSKGNYPFQNIATKTLRSRYNAYLALEQYWTEKVDPEGDDNARNSDDQNAPSPSQEIRQGIDDLFEMVRNFTDARAAERDEIRMKDLVERGQVHEMKVRALFHLDKALDGAVAASKSNVAMGSSVPSSGNSSIKSGHIIEIMGKDDDLTSNDDGLSRNESPDASNPKMTSTPARHSNRSRKGIHGISELERIHQNFQVFKETKAQSRLELRKEREKRKRTEAETAQLEQENTRLRLELQNSQIQANITLQQQMMEQQMQMQQQMMAMLSRLTNQNQNNFSNETESRNSK